MKIYNYFLSLSKEINKINDFITESQNYNDKYNPFNITKPMTIVWVEKEH